LKPKNKKIFKITLTVVACLVVIYFGISAYGAREAMAIPRLPLLYQGGVLGVPYEEVSFKTRTDGISLKGWFLPGSGSQVIVFIHGGFQNRLDENVDTKELAPALVKRGYNVLLFDLRGRGESEGKGISLSYYDEDIGGAVDYLRSRGFALKDINVIGFCSGAALTSYYVRNNELGGVILDGCFYDCGTMVVRQAESINLPGWLARFFTPGGTLLTRLMYGYHRIDPVDVIPQIGCPILFFHEQHDPFTTSRETQWMYEKTLNPLNETWDIPYSKHSMGYRTYPQKYVDTLDNFLKKLR
jgi:uncharacterized protein